MLGEVIFGAETVASGTSEMVLVAIDEVSGKFQSAAIRWQFESADGKQARKLTGSNLPRTWQRANFWLS